MDRSRLHLPVWLLCPLTGLALFLASVPTFAGAVLAADIHGGFWKLGAQTPSKIRIGNLPAQIVGLELGADGELFGLEANGNIWLLDPDTGDGVLLSPAPVGGDLEYRDLVEFEEELILLRFDLLTETPQLVRVNLDEASREVLGDVTSTLGIPFADSFDPHSMIAGSPASNTVFLLDHSATFKVDLDVLEAQEETAPVDFVAMADVDFDPESTTMWVLSERTEGEPGLELVGVDVLAFKGWTPPSRAIVFLSVLARRLSLSSHRPMSARRIARLSACKKVDSTCG